MKKISLFVLINFLFLISIKAQEDELHQLETMQNKSAMANFQGDEQRNNQPNLCSLLNDNKVCSAAINPKKVKYSQSYETHNVQIIVYGGYNFHIADYVDGTRVVTCLDGADQGLQGIGVNGIRQNESRDVKWYNGYFIHFYAAGKVISYPNKQIIEIY